MVLLLVREGDDEEDVLVLVELVADRRRQVGLKVPKTDSDVKSFNNCSARKFHFPLDGWS